MRDVGTGEQLQEVALAGAVETDDSDALAEQDLGVERIGQPLELESLGDEDALARARAAELHRHLLRGRPRGRWLTFEALEARLRRPDARSELVAAHLRAPAELVERLDEVLLLLEVTAVLIVESRKTRVTGLVIAREAAAVGP